MDQRRDQPIAVVIGEREPALPRFGAHAMAYGQVDEFGGHLRNLERHALLEYQVVMRAAVHRVVSSGLSRGVSIA